MNEETKSYLKISAMILASGILAGILSGVISGCIMKCAMKKQFDKISQKMQHYNRDKFEHRMPRTIYDSENLEERYIIIPKDVVKSFQDKMKFE